MSFIKDLNESRQKEKDFEARLQEIGYVTTNTQVNDYFPYYDVTAYNPLKDRTTTFEVKYDKVSVKTGNVGVELYKCISGDTIQPSGLSLTTAEYHTYIFPNDNKFYIVPTEALKQLVQNKRVVSGGDNYSTSIALISKEIFIEKCIVI